MWQRRQTLFLAIGVLLCATLYFMDLASYQRTGDGELVRLRLNGLFGAGGELREPALAIPLAWLNGIVIALMVVSIGLFRNRTRQQRFTRMAFLFSLLLIAALAFTHNSVASAMGTAASVKSTLAPGMYFPLILPVLIWLAERGIKKDEELVRSADRLR